MARQACLPMMAIAGVLLAACGVQPVIAPQPVTVPDAQAQALFSRRVPQVVSLIFTQYDHNRNGEIELERPTGGSLLSRIGNFLFWRDERVRSVTNTYTENDQLSVTTRVYTRFPLFFPADPDNNKRLTFDELTAFVNRNYDLNNDGALNARGLAFWRPKNEIERFNSDFREDLISYRDIDLPKPVSPGAPSAPPSAGPGPQVPVIH